jgi:hypothetical protein
MFHLLSYLLVGHIGPKPLQNNRNKKACNPGGKGERIEMDPKEKNQQQPQEKYQFQRQQQDPVRVREKAAIPGPRARGPTQCEGLQTPRIRISYSITREAL